MKKRDLAILGLLVILVVALTAWENIQKREKAELQDQRRMRERVELEKRLSGQGLALDSLKLEVLRVIDSLRVEAAAFESVAVARQEAMEQQLAVKDSEPAPEATPPEDIETRAEQAALNDTMPKVIREEYEQALAALPDDLTRYEQRIATQEVENAITAKFGLSHQEFEKIKREW